jgi:hypothetical protein
MGWAILVEVTGSQTPAASPRLPANRWPSGQRVKSARAVPEQKPRTTAFRESERQSDWRCRQPAVGGSTLRRDGEACRYGTSLYPDDGRRTHGRSPARSGAHRIFSRQSLHLAWPGSAEIVCEFPSFQRHLGEIANVSLTLETFPSCKCPSLVENLRNRTQGPSHAATTNACAATIPPLPASRTEPGSPSIPIPPKIRAPLSSGVPASREPSQVQRSG